jgi:4-hydroxy-3-methylbut-2-enyl diphosphate reductase
MRIEKAAEMGFCFGVRRAIGIVEKAVAERGPLQTLGALVHNQQVVDRLADWGVTVAQTIDDIETTVVAVTSHGASPGTLEALRGSGHEIIDATCPFVRKAQVATENLAESGFWVHVFGDSDHPEVRGLLGWAGEQSSASTDLPPSDTFGKKLGVVCQTTQSPEAFGRFLSQLAPRQLNRLSELRVVNTICDATRRNQEAAVELSGRVQAMVVIGGRDSANTKRLAELCTATGTPTYRIETAGDLSMEWFRGISVVGVTAGASTPDDVIEEVVRSLSTLPGGS